MMNRPVLPSTTVTGIALRFVAELQAGRRPSIESSLDQAPSDEWAGLLQSLLIAETNFRKSRGEAPVAREYLPRFPAHAEVIRAVVPDQAQRPAMAAPVPMAEEVVPQPPAPAQQVWYREAPAVVVAPLPASAPMARPAVPMAVSFVESHAFADLEPDVEFTPPLPGQRRRRRWKRWVAVVVVLLLAASAAVFVPPLLRPKGNEPPPAVPGGSVAGPKGSGYNPFGAPKGSNADAERDLAEWVLSLRGRGTVLPEGSSRRPFSPEAPLPKSKYEVTSIVLPPDAAGLWKTGDLERLRGREKLGSIQLNVSGPITESTLAPLTGLPLRTLEIVGGPVQASGTFFAAFPDLEVLTLPSSPDFTDADLAAIGKLTKLSSLSLNSAKFTPMGFKQLTSPTIKSLTFGEAVAFTPDHVSVLARLPIEEFESGAGMNDNAFLEMAVFQDLKRIRLRKTTLTDAGLKAVVGLGKLEEFRAEGSAVTGPGLEHLAERTGLKIVDLSNAKLTDESMAMLLALPPLKELRLAGNPIGDKSAPQLAQLEGTELLDLSATDIGDVTMRALQKHDTLKTLIVTNTKVTAAAVREFEMATPACKVQFGRRK